MPRRLTGSVTGDGSGADLGLPSLNNSGGLPVLGQSPSRKPRKEPSTALAKARSGCFPAWSWRRGNTSRPWFGLSGLRDLRNHVFHYEPLWKGRTTYAYKTIPLPRDHGETGRVVSWISPELAATLGVIDRFAPIYAKGTSPLLVMALAYRIGNKEPY